MNATRAREHLITGAALTLAGVLIGGGMAGWFNHPQQGENSRAAAAPPVSPATFSSVSSTREEVRSADSLPPRSPSDQAPLPPQADEEAPVGLSTSSVNVTVAFPVSNHNATDIGNGQLVGSHASSYVILNWA